MKPILIATIAVVLLAPISISAISQYEIPAWVKGVAGFWAEDKISDTEFGEGLTFLIDSEIIKVPKIQELENKIAQLEAENRELEDSVRIKLESSQECSPYYLDVCIPAYPPDLDCGEILFANFRVVEQDPHGFDRDNDGIGCES